MTVLCYTNPLIQSSMKTILFKFLEVKSPYDLVCRNFLKGLPLEYLFRFYLDILNQSVYRV